MTMMKELSMALGSIVELKIDFNFTAAESLALYSLLPWLRARLLAKSCKPNRAG
jgi:hypothetical protein